MRSSKPKSAWISVTGATHLFEEPGALEAVADLAAHWFARHFRGKDARPAPTIDLPAEPDRRTNPELPNKREMIQTVIDEEEEPWIIMKPSCQDPTDPEAFVFSKILPNRRKLKPRSQLLGFKTRELQKIKKAIQQSLRHALSIAAYLRTCLPHHPP